MSEQRQHKRVKSFNVIKALGPEGREIQQESALVNISEGGLLFYSTEQVEPSSKIEIHIEIPEFNSSITVGASVKWTQAAMERPNSYFVGVQFTKLEDSDRGVLRQLAEKTDSES